MNPGELENYNGMATLDRPLREEVDVALGRLMAAIEDARTEILGVVPLGTMAVARMTMKEFTKVVQAKDCYDAARLSKSGEPLWEGAA